MQLNKAIEILKNDAQFATTKGFKNAKLKVDAVNTVIDTINQLNSKLSELEMKLFGASVKNDTIEQYNQKIKAVIQCFIGNDTEMYLSLINFRSLETINEAIKQTQLELIDRLPIEAKYALEIKKKKGANIKSITDVTHKYEYNDKMNKKYYNVIHSIECKQHTAKEVANILLSYCMLLEAEREQKNQQLTAA